MRTYFVSFCMKVAVAVLALGFVSAPVMQARSGKHSQIMKVIRKYDGCDGVESIVIGSFLMGIARLASSGEEGDEILKYIDKMARLSADEAGPGLKNNISSDLEKALEGYEKAVEVKDGEDDMTIYITMPAGDSVSEMVIVSRSEPAVILMLGDMPVSELENIAREASEN